MKGLRIYAVLWGAVVAAPLHAQDTTEQHTVSNEAGLSAEAGELVSAGEGLVATHVSPTSFLQFNSLAAGKAGIYAILQKLNATLNPSLSDAVVKKIRAKGGEANPRDSVLSAHWMREKFGRAQELRTSADWTRQQRDYFVNALSALSDQEKAFLAMTMTAYGRENDKVNSANCPPTLNASSNDAARERCFRDERSASAMRAQMRKFLEGAQGDENASRAVFDKLIQDKDWQAGLLGKLPEMIRGLAHSVESPKERLGRDTRALGFERAIQAYMDAAKDAGSGNGIAVAETPSREGDTESHEYEGPVEQAKPIEVVKNGAKKLQGYVKNTGAHPIKTAKKVIESAKEKFVSVPRAQRRRDLTPSNAEELADEVAMLMAKAREELLDAAGPELKRRVIQACNSGERLSVQDHERIYQLIPKVLKEYGDTLEDSGAYDRRKFGGYSLLDLFSFTGTAFTEARLRAGRDDLGVRAEMAATMYVMENRSVRHPLKFPFTIPTIYQIVSSRTAKDSDGDVLSKSSPNFSKRFHHYTYQFSGWGRGTRPGDPNFACMVSSGSASQQTSHDLAARSFVDLIDSRTDFGALDDDNPWFFRAGRYSADGVPIRDSIRLGLATAKGTLAARYVTLHKFSNKGGRRKVKK